ncbi:MAG: MBOAT family O-acyltransferase [Bacillota bacterium]|nr:MBOAT family O-acyltransferase [Bacillota bacterium]
MNLTSFGFYFALFAFVVLYYTVFKKRQWLMILVSGWIINFYVERLAGLYLIITTVSVHLLAGRIERLNQEHGKKEAKKYSKKYMVLGVLINLGILFGLKYLRAFEHLLHLSSFRLTDIVVPLGISFYTFKAIAYLVDVYRSKYPAQRNLLQFAAFVGYYPAFFQGPIDRYDEMSKTLYTEKRFDVSKLVEGLYLILFGLLKKIVVADRLTGAVSQAVANYEMYQGSVLFFVMFLFGIQIYADFSGGIDMIRGFSKILGIELSRNFNSPYLADSVAEYWRRWHITLGAFMREYVFYPMSFSKFFVAMNQRSRSKMGAKYGKVFNLLISTLVVYLLIGAWHGPRMISLLFGLFYGVIISISILLKDVRAKWDRLIRLPDRLKYGLKILWVCQITTVGRYFSKADTPSELFRMLRYTVSNFFGDHFFAHVHQALGMSVLNYAVLAGAILIMMAAAYYQEKLGDFVHKIKASRPVLLYGFFVFAFTLILVFGLLQGEHSNIEFVYQKY